MLEISSFQLETVAEFHPQIAVILNITPDHLDRHGSFVQYAHEKEKIFAQQTAGDFLVLNAGRQAGADGRGAREVASILVQRHAAAYQAGERP